MPRQPVEMHVCEVHNDHGRRWLVTVFLGNTPVASRQYDRPVRASDFDHETVFVWDASSFDAQLGERAIDRIDFCNPA